MNDPVALKGLDQKKSFIYHCFILFKASHYTQKNYLQSVYLQYTIQGDPIMLAQVIIKGHH